MATYAGTGARGSLSLDEDDLSDVEDDVFIRDGRNGFKFVEDHGLNRPLMAPRRKLSRMNFPRLKHRQSFRAFCIPCCYASAALTLFTGLIALVVILVSMFPLPLEKLKFWKEIGDRPMKLANDKVLPCIDFEVVYVWNTTLPKFTSECAMRKLDVNSDGVEDVVFGFGVGADVILPPQIFCPMFMNMRPPCQGGVVALNGLNGQQLWRTWLPNTVFNLFCTTDLNGDNTSDCIASGRGGVLSAINARDGSILWNFKSDETSLVMDVYAASFVPDQDGDNVPDIVAAHTSQKGKSRIGLLLLISGKSGQRIARLLTPKKRETYFPPQPFVYHDGTNAVIFGTGSESSSGGLYMMPLWSFARKEMVSQLLFEDTSKGVLSPSILVDITGDKEVDIVTAFFNSTVVAIDGRSLKQIWNYTLPSSESLSAPIPGYFNNDNITDFMIKYEKGAGFPTYYYSQVLIIDGANGKPIYEPIVSSFSTQMAGLTVSSEKHGFDTYLYWSADCTKGDKKNDEFRFAPGSNIMQRSRANICDLRFNASTRASFYAINQYNQPPGVRIYNSDNFTRIEYNNSKNPLDEAQEYMNSHPNFDKIANEVDDIDEKIEIEMEKSNFRHRDGEKAKIKTKVYPKVEPQNDNKYDFPWMEKEIDDPLQVQDYNNYDETNDFELRSPKQRMPDRNYPSNRDPRSRNGAGKPLDHQAKNQTGTSSYGVNDYQNVYKARHRLLNDLSDVPSNILRETYLKSMEQEMRRSSGKFEQRDLRFHADEANGTEDRMDVLEERVKGMEAPLSLWDLESEKEAKEKENEYLRGKRYAEARVQGIPKTTSTGVLVQPLNPSHSGDTIDVIFGTQWLPPKPGAQIVLKQDQDCIDAKFKQASASKDEYRELGRSALESLFTRMCLQDRGAMLDGPYNEENEPDFANLRKTRHFDQIREMSIGQMTIYRVQLRCKCDLQKKDERCTKFLSGDQQTWDAFMGKLGDGYFKTRK